MPAHRPRVSVDNPHDSRSVLEGGGGYLHSGHSTPILLSSVALRSIYVFRGLLPSVNPDRKARGLLVWSTRVDFARDAILSLAHCHICDRIHIYDCRRRGSGLP